MSRALAAILTVALILATAALGQSPGAAPATHPGTKLSFPPSLGGAALLQSRFEPPLPGGRTGLYSYQYSTTDKMQIAVSIFDGGRHVPSGSDNPAVTSQFAGEVATAEREIKTNGYTGFERPAVPSSCVFGAVAFRCIVYSATAPGGRLFSKMLLTGFHNSFVLIHVSWTEASGHTAVDADRALQAFVPALMH